MTPKKNTDPFLLFIVKLCTLIVLVALSLFNLSLYISNKNSSIPADINAKRQTVDNETSLTFWLGALAKEPNYLPGWLEVAKINCSEGNKPACIAAIAKAREINPNDATLRELTKKWVDN